MGEDLTAASAPTTPSGGDAAPATGGLPGGRDEGELARTQALNAETDYLSLIQKAAAEPPSAEDESAISAAAPAAPVAEPGTPEAPATPEATEDEGPDEALNPEVLANLKRMHPDVRKQVRSALFRAKAFTEAGFTVAHAKALKDVNFTPEAALEIRTLFATNEDAKIAAQRAYDMQRLASDFHEDPAMFAENLRKTNEESYRKLATHFAEQVPTLAPEVWGQHFSSGVLEVLSRLDAKGQQEANEDGADLVAAVKIIKGRLFPQGEQGAPTADIGYENLPAYARQALEERDRLKAQQQTFLSQRQQHFNNAVFEATRQEALKEIENRVKAAIPSSLPKPAVDKMVGDVGRALLEDIQNSPSLMADLKALYNRGDYSNAHFEQVLRFLIPRVTGKIPLHVKQQAEAYAPFFRQAPPQVQAPRPAPAPAPARDAGKIPGAAPQPAAAAPAPFKGGSTDDYLRVIQVAAARARR